MTEGRLPHIVLTQAPETSNYTTTRRGQSKPPPSRDRATHGAYLQIQLNTAWEEAENESAVSHATRNGIYLEFISDPDSELELKSLENLPKKIRLLNVREITDPDNNTRIQYATVYIPNAQKNFFLDKISDYLHVNTSKDKPKNAALINTISNIRKALLVDSFWSDAYDLIPTNVPEWIEVWLSSDNLTVISAFESLLGEQEIQFKEGIIKFPERAVKVIYANNAQLEKLSELSDHIAEYRKAKVSAELWMTLNNKDQSGWVDDLLGRINIDLSSEASVCILDTGVNNGHPLIRDLLIDDDCHTVNEAWGKHDHDKHGTLMAGISGFGNLIDALNSSSQIELTHNLESVKILPPPPEQNTANIWGYITSQAVSRAEIQAPNRQRSFCMAITAEDTRDRGRPTSWSAQIDQLSSGANDDTQRLIILSAGNTTASITDAAIRYPDIQLTDSVHDPAQSWNALTVGAYTTLTQITDPTLNGYSSVAPEFGLSPFSTTSSTWEENKWPIKPELVMEGGNLAIDESSFVTECDDLSLLSTFYNPQQAHFSTFSMTSAAAAQLAWMSGKLNSAFPEFWPETIRALLVHSASWPETLKRQFINDESKTSYKHLLSVCGYGIPDLEKALHSAKNSLTLINQSTLQPFDKKPTGGYRTKDMHLHELPWPKETLLDLPHGTPVEMRITLSYFIEAGPGEIGWKNRYRYASHALRFDLNSPSESKDEFLKRINKAARDSDESGSGTSSPSDHWLLGSQARDRGSIHSDIWKGTAADLAASNLIGISPTIGWWRERSHLGKWDKATRYSLIVSITTPDQTVDLYTPVSVQVGLPVPVEVVV